jgi:PhnB protein
MPEANNSAPSACTSITPKLAIHGAADAIQFYQRAFGAIELFRLSDAGGKVAHAQMKLGDSLFALAEEHVDYNISPHTLGNSTVLLHIEVADANAVFDRAVAAGAKVIFPLRDQFYGERSGRLVDPYGHLWMISQHIEHVSPAEMQRRFTAISSGTHAVAPELPESSATQE